MATPSGNTICVSAEDKQELARTCLQAKENAHCPYSNFRVGSAVFVKLKTGERKIFTGRSLMVVKTLMLLSFWWHYMLLVGRWRDKQTLCLFVTREYWVQMFKILYLISFLATSLTSISHTLSPVASFCCGALVRYYTKPCPFREQTYWCILYSTKR